MQYERRYGFFNFQQMFGFVKSFQIFIRLHLADCHWFAETKAMCNLCIYSLPVWLSMTKWKRTFETLFVLYTTVAHSRIQAISYTDQSSDPARERYPITSYKSKCILIFQWIDLKMFFFLYFYVERLNEVPTSFTDSLSATQSEQMATLISAYNRIWKSKW